MPPKYSALELPSELTSSPSESGTCWQLRIEPHIDARDPDHTRKKPCRRSGIVDPIWARKGRPSSRRAALSIRRLTILRGARRVGAGGRSRKGTVRIKVPKDLFQWARSIFAKRGICATVIAGKRHKPAMSSRAVLVWGNAGWIAKR